MSVLLFFLSIIYPCRYETPQVALNCGIMLRECIRHEPLAKIILHSEHFNDFFSYVEMSTFDIASDAFATFKARTRSWHNRLIFSSAWGPELIRFSCCCSTGPSHKTQGSRGRIFRTELRCGKWHLRVYIYVFVCLFVCKTGTVFCVVVCAGSVIF